MQSVDRTMGESSDWRSAIKNIRIDENAVTKIFNDENKLIAKKVREVLERNHIKLKPRQDGIRISGDDITGKPRNQEIPPEVVKELADELAKVVDPASMRMTVVGKDVPAGATRDEFAGLGDKIEQYTRSIAEEDGFVSYERTEQMLFSVHMGAEQALDISSREAVTEVEKKHILDAFERAKAAAIKEAAEKPKPK